MSPDMLDVLTRDVTDQAGRLESPAEASAVLEAMGHTDATVQEAGWPDVFALGLDIYEHQADNVEARDYRMRVERVRRAAVLEEHEPSPLRTFLPRFALKGFTFGAPMVLMLLAVLILLYSLWAYFYFDVARGSAIAIGTVASYLVTAGFMQAIGRRGLMYLRQEMFVLSLKISLFLVVLGFATVVVTAVLLWLALLVFPVVAPRQIPVAILYFVCLSCLWLGLSLVYMLQQEIWFTIAIGVGIGIVYVLREGLKTSIILAHAVGILCAGFLGLAVGTIMLKRMERKVRRTRKEPLAGKLPRLSVIALSVAPYFLYGFLYFSFLFLDRLLAWTGKAPFRQSFVWFQSDYEVGLNWALVALLFSFGVLEFTVYRLGERLDYLAEFHSLLRLREFRTELLSFYRRSVLAYLGSAVIGIVVAYVTVRYLLVPHVPLVGSLVTTVSLIVFVVSAIAYVLVVWALLNNVFLFSLSRPGYAIRAVAPALVADLVVGFVCSRMIAYWGAVFGLLAGAIVFWLISTYYTIKMLRRIDYYAYSAF